MGACDISPAGRGDRRGGLGRRGHRRLFPPRDRWRRSRPGPARARTVDWPALAVADKGLDDHFGITEAGRDRAKGMAEHVRGNVLVDLRPEDKRRDS